MTSKVTRELKATQKLLNGVSRLVRGHSGSQGHGKSYGSTDHTDLGLLAFRSDYVSILYIVSETQIANFTYPTCILRPCWAGDRMEFQLCHQDL